MSHRLATQVWVDVSKDTARAWNAARESGYTDEMWVVCYWFEDVPRTHLNLVSPTRFLDLWGRFETPNERARWDAPLFRPLDTSASRDDSEDYHGDYGVEPLPEGAKDVLGADFIDSTSCGPGGGGSDTASGVAADPAPHGGSGGGAAGAAAAAGSGAGGSAGAGAGASAPAPRAESGNATGVPATAGTDAGMALLPYDDIVAALLDSKKDTKLNHSTIKVPGVSVCRWGALVFDCCYDCIADPAVRHESIAPTRQSDAGCGVCPVESGARGDGGRRYACARRNSERTLPCRCGLLLPSRTTSMTLPRRIHSGCAYAEADTARTAPVAEAILEDQQEPPA